MICVHSTRSTSSADIHADSNTFHLTVFRLDYHANKYLARISTTPASHRPRRYLRHCPPTRSNRRHAQIRIQTGPDVLPLVNLPHDRAGHRFRRAVPIQDSRLPVLALADRSLLDIVACGVGRDAHPDQVSRGESLLLVLLFPLDTYTHTHLHLQYLLHPDPESTLVTPPNPTPLDVPISQRPHPTYAEKSRAVYQSRQAAKLRLDALNAPAAVRYRESHGPAVHAIFRRNNEMSAVDRKAFERRRDYKYKTWGMRRLSPLRYETKVEYDDLGEPGYYLRHNYIPPVPYDWRSYPARVPLHPNAWSTENNGKWGRKRSFQTAEDLAGDLPRVRPIPKLARLGFVDLGPLLERKRFPSAMEVYVTSCKIRARRVFRFQDEVTAHRDRSLS